MQRRAFLAAPTALMLPAAAWAAAANGAITDVPGIAVGHWTSDRRPTGCSVVLVPEGATGGVDVRGAAPGTRETDLLDPGNLVSKVHAVLLTGGSAFGLDAAGGVVRWLEERGFGFPAGPARVPIVPAAVLFDLGMGDPSVRPDAASGYAACAAATGAAPAEGSVGAGAGATVGKLFGLGRATKGGIGTASLRLGGITVGALVAVNAVGDVRNPATGAVRAGLRAADGRPGPGSVATILGGEVPPALAAGTNTTIGVIATDAELTKTQCRRLAGQGHDGMARAVEPSHTMWDGDTLFALATGRSGKAGNMMALGLLAARVVELAIIGAVDAATGAAGVPSASELR